MLVASVTLSGLDSQSSSPLRPGEYITDEGWGTLQLTRDAAGKLAFDLTALGVAGHACDLDGEIQNGAATLATADEASKCVVLFTATSEGIEVRGDREACRSFCGARAGFESMYLRPARGCTTAALSTTRTTFKRFYDKKAYRQALSTLEPVITRCARTLQPVEDGAIRNDVALTLYHLGQRARCLAVLDPLRLDADTKDEDLPYERTDLENMMPTIRATRTNLKLCNAK
jgi:hypothetical protein